MGQASSHSPLITNEGHFCPKLEIKWGEHTAIRKLVQEGSTWFHWRERETNRGNNGTWGRNPRAKAFKADERECRHLHMWGLLGSSVPGAHSAERQPLGGRSRAHSCTSRPAQGRRCPCCWGCAFHAGFLEAADKLGKEQVPSSCQLWRNTFC